MPGPLANDEEPQLSFPSKRIQDPDLYTVVGGSSANPSMCVCVHGCVHVCVCVCVHVCVCAHSVVSDSLRHYGL